MGSQWVRDLETIASALLTRAHDDDASGATCGFCGQEASGDESHPNHTARCPIALAHRVVDEVEFVHRVRPPL